MEESQPTAETTERCSRRLTQETCGHRTDVNELSMEAEGEEDVQVDPRVLIMIKKENNRYG